MRIVMAALAGLLAIAPAVPARAQALQARSAAVLDLRTGRFLYELRADEPIPPASLAKMVTALLVAERLAPTETVTISRAAATAEADSILWPEGETFTVETLLHGMLMQSSNGAAVALAERVAGSVAAFRSLANARAAAFGARHSRFIDPSGLDAPGQYSTARDLAQIAAYLLRVPRLAAVVRTREYPVSWPDGSTFTIYNRNGFLRRSAGAIGVKNGFTSQAGNCVAAAAVRRGVPLVVVVMNDRRVYDDAARLMDLGFRLAPPSPSPGDPLRVDEGLPRRGPIGGTVRPAVAPPTTGGPFAPVLVFGTLSLAYSAWGWREARYRAARRRAAARGPFTIDPPRGEDVMGAPRRAASG